MVGVQIALYSLGLFGAFLLGTFFGMAVQRMAYQDSNEPEEDLTDWDGDQQ
jgi:hypothetical protein